MKKTRIVSVEKDGWFDLVTAEVTSAVMERAKSNDGCSLMLTGGNTAKGLYGCWASTAVYVVGLKLIAFSKACLELLHDTGLSYE